jgi:hypothetical protein
MLPPGQDPPSCSTGRTLPLDLRGAAEVTPDDGYVVVDKVGAKGLHDLREHDRSKDCRGVVTLRPVRVNAVDFGG